MYKLLVIALVASVTISQVPQTQACGSDIVSEVNACTNPLLSQITTCYADIANIMNCMCPMIQNYFTCVVQISCFDSATRSIMRTSFNSYQSIVTQFCTGQITLPTWRTRFTLQLTDFSAFTPTQYTANCVRIFNALGYSGSVVNTYCATWEAYITYTFPTTRNRRQTTTNVDVTVNLPADEIIPPSTDEATIELSYNDVGGSEVTSNAPVSSASVSSTNLGTTLPPGTGGSASYSSSSVALTLVAAIGAAVLAW